MERYLLFILVPALLAYVLQAFVFNKVKHKYWKHGSLTWVVPPILSGIAAYVLLPNATPELKNDPGDLNHHVFRYGYQLGLDSDPAEVQR